MKSAFRGLPAVLFKRNCRNSLKLIVVFVLACQSFAALEFYVFAVVYYCN